MSKKTFIILLKNKYLLFTTKKPTKKGNYLVGVRLFETAGKTSCDDIVAWEDAEYSHKNIPEVENWD